MEFNSFMPKHGTTVTHQTSHWHSNTCTLPSIVFFGTVNTIVNMSHVELSKNFLALANIWHAACVTARQNLRQTDLPSETVVEDGIL